MKTQLAEKACQASLSAQAALAGKKAIVEAVQAQICDAEAVLEEELVGLCNLQNAAQQASQLLCEAREQVRWNISDDTRLSMVWPKACAVKRAVIPWTSTLL